MKLNKEKFDQYIIILFKHTTNLVKITIFKNRTHGRKENLKNGASNHYPHFTYHVCELVKRKCVNALTIWLTIKKQITEDHKTQHVKYLMIKVFRESMQKDLSISISKGDAKIGIFNTYQKSLLIRINKK